MKRIVTTLAVCLGLTTWTHAAPAKVVYQNDFEKAEEGWLPDEFLIQDGDFKVTKAGTNKLVELPGAPLESFGFYFGPTEKENVAVSTRFNSTRSGRKYPTFAVSLGAGGQYKLRMSPAKRAVELYKGDDVVKTVPYDWQSGKWTTLHLQVRKDGAGWKIEGRAWQEGQDEPKDWTLTFDEKEEPIPGRAAVWGSPYSGEPIQFDDLKVLSLSP